MVAVLSYLSCIGLWVINTIVMIKKKNPTLLLVLFLTHLFELCTIGLKTGREFGEKDSVSIASCLSFGFLWWLPLRKQMKEETFTDDDFVRRDDDIVIKHD